MNPWLSMWNQPRMTIRVLIHKNSSYGVFFLSAIYALQSFFYYVNWWSLGLKYSSYIILLAGLVLSPLVGFFLLYFEGFLLYVFGRLFKGRAPVSHLRKAFAWSKIPAIIALFIWLTLIILNPETAFLQDGGGPSSIFINLITFILGIWSFVLLVGEVREGQDFSVIRSIANTLFAALASTLIVFFFVLIGRYVYLVFS